MIAKNKFVKLNVKQKIYKIASMIRSVERRLKDGEPADLSTLSVYLGYLEPDKSEPKIARAFEIIGVHLSGFDSVISVDIRIQKLNFAFHDLMELIEEPDGESFFDVRRFDANAGQRRFPVAAILDNIRSPFNVGSIFRSADAFGVGELALCGITPKPPTVKIERTAMGAVEHVLWRGFPHTKDAIAAFRARGFRILALETVKTATNLADISDFAETAIVFGNEEFGIADETLSLCDAVAAFPLVGMKNSVNVANCFAIAMYQAMLSFLDSEA